jgi:hypothetical protein
MNAKVDMDEVFPEMRKEGAIVSIPRQTVL